MKKAITSVAVIAAVLGSAWFVHETAPWNVEIIVFGLALLLYAVIASRPDKVSVPRHLHRTAGNLILGAFSTGINILGGLGLLVVAVTLSWTIWGPRIQSAGHTAETKAKTAVTGAAKDGAKSAITDLFGNLRDDFDKGVARFKDTKAGSGGRPR
jgi:ABC-type glucose/galactose transport system permease subunit